MQSWSSQGLGIRWLTLMLDDPDEGPPTTYGAQVWKDNFGLDAVAVCADPYFSMVPGQSVGTPLTTVIDPRTMKVVATKEGYDGNYSTLTSLAQQNN